MGGNPVREELRSGVSDFHTGYQSLSHVKEIDIFNQISPKNKDPTMWKKVFETVGCACKSIGLLGYQLTGNQAV